MDDKRINYFPFHAINEYMLPEFRLNVVGAVLRGLDSLSGPRRAALNNLIKRHVSVPGFRNSVAAPLGVKIRSAISPFEKYPDVAATFLQAWSELHADLRQRVHTMLQSRSFEGVLPLEADRSKLPGFLTTWPKVETYEALDEAFFAANPGFEQTPTDDIRLMVVWLVNRLPYDLFDEDETEEDAE
jgi:hypothetical protein